MKLQRRRLITALPVWLPATSSRAHAQPPDPIIPTVIKNDRWYNSLSFARGRPANPARIPTGVNDESSFTPVGISAFFQQHERMTGGHFGFYAHDLKSGRTLAWREHERFVMCSTFKMSLAACVLYRVDRGQEQLGRFVRYSAADLVEHAPIAQQNLAHGGMTVAAMSQAAVEFSDNTCADKLLASIGGPGALTEFWRATGDSVSRLDHTEPKLNFTPPGGVDDTTTPAAMAGNLRRFVLGDVLTLGSRQMLTSWMLNCQTGADLLRAGLAGWKVADKTGNNGLDALGDLAIGWSRSGKEVVMCCYTRGGSPKMDALRAIFANVGGQVAAQFGEG